METPEEKSNDVKKLIDEYELKNLIDEAKKVSKKLKWRLIILISLLLIFVAILIRIGWEMKIESKKTTDMLIHRSDSLQYRSDSLENFSRIASDSLQKYSGYKTLYTSIMARDAATKQLYHQVGDVIYCKPDSLRSVITDVIIGGSKYDYYVKYKIKTGLGSETYEVIPEQLY
jgi:hypothetical protein